MKIILAMIALFATASVYAAFDNTSGKRCSFPGEAEDHSFGCCEGTQAVRVSEDGLICEIVDKSDPTNKRCSFPGEYEDHRYGCCPGTESVRVSNDGYICELK